MWVFIRPRGGQDYYLLEKKNTAGGEFCPIHRFDGKDQISMFRIAAACGGANRAGVSLR
jgi:hypothetical protein